MLCGLSSREPLNRFRAHFLSWSSVPMWSLLFVKERRSQNYKSGNNNRANASKRLRYAYPCRPNSSHLRKVFQLICCSPYRRAGVTICSYTREKCISNFDGLSDKQVGVYFVVCLNNFSQMRDNTFTYGYPLPHPLRKKRRSVVMSGHLSARNDSAPTGRIFMKFYILKTSGKSVDIRNFH